MLKKKCLYFAKQLQALQELARIDLDLLALSMDFDHIPQAEVELDKVQRLVHDLLSMEEEVCHAIQMLEKDLYEVDEDEEMVSCDKNSSTDWTRFPNQVVKRKSLDNVLSELTTLYTWEEIMDGFNCFLEQSMVSSTVRRLRQKQRLSSNQNRNLGLSFPAHSDNQGNSDSNSCLQEFRVPWISAEHDVKTLVTGGGEIRSTLTTSGINSMSGEASGDIVKIDLDSLQTSPDTDIAEPNILRQFLPEFGEKVLLLPPVEGTSQQQVESSERDPSTTSDKSADLQSEVGEKQLGDISRKLYSSQKRPHIHEKVHSKSHQEKVRKERRPTVMKCPHCDKVMGVRILRNHLITQHSSTSTFRPYKCDTCGSAFRLKCYLTSHVKANHSQLQHYGKQLCTLCNKYFYNLSRHMAVHTGEKPYQCYFCGLSFVNRDTFKKHERKQHTGVWPHHCSKCTKGFLYVCGLRKHEEMCGTNDGNPSTNANSPFKCSLCGKGCRRSWSLAYHSMSHKDELKTCLICEEIFNSPLEVEPHVQNIHLGEKSFKCHVCGEAFFLRSQLAAHVALHKNKDAFRCKICFFTGSSHESISSHMKRRHIASNRILQCSICEKSFRHSQELRRHESIHKNIKPHHCGICGMQFRLRYMLKVHEWTHKTIKKYNCDKCDKGFNDKRNLVSHLKTHNETRDNKGGQD